MSISELFAVPARRMTLSAVIGIAISVLGTQAVVRADPVTTVNVTVVATPFDWDTLDDDQGMTTGITATVDAAPQTTDELQVDGPYWSWDDQVQSQDSTGQPQTADDTVCDAGVDQPDPQAPDASISVLFFADGVYQVYVKAHVVYHVTDQNGSTYDVTGDSPAWVAIDADTGQEPDTQTTDGQSTDGQ